MKKILRAITVRLQESASNIHKIRFFFFDTRFGGHGLKDCSRVTEHPAVALKVSRFYCQDFFGWSHESYRLHVPLLPTLVSVKPVHAVTHERHLFLYSNCKGFGHW